MAARVQAAALCSVRRLSLIGFLLVYLSVSTTYAYVSIKYSRHELINIGLAHIGGISGVYDQTDFPTEIVRPPGSPWIIVPAGRGRRRRKDRKQKRGCRTGVRTRLARDPYRPPLPSLFVANVRSLPNKMEELELTMSAQKNIQDCCVLVITETWINATIPEEAIQLAGYATHRADRTSDSGKSRGGGLCAYINNSWCTDAKITDMHCSQDLEYLTVKCRPFYLPREHSVVIITAVYIPPHANITIALGYLLTAISKQQIAHPNGVLMIAGNFNQANLNTVLPKLYQYVKCPTRGKSTLDHVYSNIKHGFKARALPHIGNSDHTSLFLTPVYRPLINTVKPAVKVLRVWPECASEQLQDCFECTDWSIFVDDNIDTYTSSVLFYIKSCMDVVTITKQIRIFPNNKPWMNKDVRLQLKARNMAFRSGDLQNYNVARSELKRSIRDAKTAYRRRIEGHFENSDPRRAWQGIQHIIKQVNNNNSPTNNSTVIAGDLNHFFSRHEVVDAEPARTLAPVTNNQGLVLQTAEVLGALRKTNIWKATGPDGVPGRVIRACARELAGVFTDIFNISLSKCSVPTCLKSSIIVPIPKQTVITGFNDYRPVALTPIIMKCFERLVLEKIKAALPVTLDSHQYAYRTNRSTDDAISIALYTVLQHLEQPGTYARLLFVDYSSALNTILPGRLFHKMTNLGLDYTICLWIRNFLTNRSQTVRMGNYHSSPLSLSTGAPQGCVLSPFLYSLYTHDCTPTHKTNTIIKFADDMTVVGLISRGDELAYREEVQRLIDWCVVNNLSLNTKKQKSL